MRTADLRSPIFDRTNGTSEPRLSHPTSNSFDLAQWLEVKDNSSSLRDLRLSVSALFFGTEIQSLRSRVISERLAPLSRKTARRLAIARSNRSYFLIRARMLEALKAQSETDSAAIFSALNQTRIKGGFDQPDIAATDLITTVVDSVPHWLAEAKSLTAEKDDPTYNFGRNGQLVEAAMSIELGYKNLWQQALFEGSHLDLKDGELTFIPDDYENAVLWDAWAWRQQSVTDQYSNFDWLHRRRLGTSALIQGPISKTAIAVSRNGRRISVKVGPPSLQMTARHVTEMTAIEECYLSGFLDQPLYARSKLITLRTLSNAWLVLEDYATALSNSIRTREVLSYKDARELSLAVNVSALAKCISSCLDLSKDDAHDLISVLTTDPDELGRPFRRGVWHRPLISNPGEDEVFLLLAAILAGSPVRRLEQWMQDSGIDQQLKATSSGIRFERETRTLIAEKLQNNPIVSDKSSSINSIKKSNPNGQEIDCVVRIGRKVIVCEIKCFLFPTEPSDKYNHLAKLEKAAEQANVKTAWLKSNINILIKSIGDIPHAVEELEFVPVVLLNQGCGVGLVIDGCIVTDITIFSNYLSDGDYVSGAAMAFETNDLEIMRETVYRTAKEAEAKVEAYLTKPPSFQPFIRSARWDWLRFPTASGRPLSIAIPKMDRDGLVTPVHKAAMARLEDQVAMQKRLGKSPTRIL